MLTSRSHSWERQQISSEKSPTVSKIILPAKAPTAHVDNVKRNSTLLDGIKKKKKKGTFRAADKAICKCGGDMDSRSCHRYGSLFQEARISTGARIQDYLLLATWASNSNGNLPLPQRCTGRPIPGTSLRRFLIAMVHFWLNHITHGELNQPYRDTWVWQVSAGVTARQEAEPLHLVEGEITDLSMSF